MAYGLRTRLPSPLATLETQHDAPCGLSSPRRWQSLSEACRLDLVERALGPGKLFADGFPASL
jgi:hypothetical protein